MHWSQFLATVRVEGQFGWSEVGAEDAVGYFPI